MSLAIEVDDVQSVLLADGWHAVEDASFSLDSYEYIWGTQVAHGGGQNGISAAGFSFTEPGGMRIAGPLTAVIAVRYVLGSGTA